MRAWGHSIRDDRDNQQPTASSAPPSNVSDMTVGCNGMAIHRCDIKACINPRHLIWGSRSDNRKGHAPLDSPTTEGYMHLPCNEEDLLSLGAESSSSSASEDAGSERSDAVPDNNPAD